MAGEALIEKVHYHLTAQHEIEYTCITVFRFEDYITVKHLM